MQSWIALLSAIFGGLIGVSGTLLGSRMQLKEARRGRNEQYAREDKFRLHRDRLEAYSDFYVAAGNARASMASHKAGTAGADARNEVWRAFIRVLLIGNRTVLDAATAILVHVTEVVFQEARFDDGQYRVLINKL